MSKRKTVLVIECQQEVSSFNPVPSRYGQFAIDSGEAFAAARRDTGTYVGGALEVLEADRRLDVIPVIGALACSAGELAGADYARLREEILAALQPLAPSADAVYFALHGSMAAQGELDPEGDLLARARLLCGADVPFVMSLDLHGVPTARMLALCPAVAALHTYPHVDLADTGRRAARLLQKVLFEGARPVAARVRLPMLVRGDECKTETGLYGRFIDRAKALEARPGILAASLFIGNPFTDVPELCTQAIVVADGDGALAAREALGLVDGLFEQRANIQAKLVSLESAIAEARGLAGPIVFTDAADAPSSGATGDSNLIVRGLLASGFAGSILAPVTDAPAVAEAHRLGVGASARWRIGGSLDPRFEPLEIEARVALLGDGRYVLESWGTRENAGRTAVLEAGRLTLVATSQPVSLFDRSLFLAHGRDPRRFDAIVVKSPHCQPQFFDDYASRNFNVDVPGSTSANLPTLGHTRCVRPIYPLDPDTTFEPVVESFAG